MNLIGLASPTFSHIYDDINDLYNLLVTIPIERSFFELRVNSNIVSSAFGLTYAHTPVFGGILTSETLKSAIVFMDNYKHDSADDIVTEFFEIKITTDDLNFVTSLEGLQNYHSLQRYIIKI